MLVGDRKTHAHVEDVGVVVHEAVCVALHHRVGAAKVVGHVFFREWLSSQWAVFRVGEEATAADVAVVNVELAAQFSQKEGPIEVVTQVDGEFIGSSFQEVDGVVARTMSTTNERHHVCRSHSQNLFFYFTV